MHWDSAWYHQYRNHVYRSVRISYSHPPETASLEDDPVGVALDRMVRISPISFQGAILNAFLTSIVTNAYTSLLLSGSVPA